MRGGGDSTAAHNGDGLAELVCSNSFRSDDDEKNAVGLLHYEMRHARQPADGGGGKGARASGIGAGGGPRCVLGRSRGDAAGQPTLEIVRERVDVLPSDGLTIVATGPADGPCP